MYLCELCVHVYIAWLGVCVCVCVCVCLCVCVHVCMCVKVQSSESEALMCVKILYFRLFIDAFLLFFVLGITNTETNCVYIVPLIILS